MTEFFFFLGGLSLLAYKFFFGATLHTHIHKEMREEIPVMH